MGTTHLPIALKLPHCLSVCLSVCCRNGDGMCDLACSSGSAGCDCRPARPGEAVGGPSCYGAWTEDGQCCDCVGMGNHGGSDECGHQARSAYAQTVSPPACDVVYAHSCGECGAYTGDGECDEDGVTCGAGTDSADCCRGGRVKLWEAGCAVEGFSLSLSLSLCLSLSLSVSLSVSVSRSLFDSVYVSLCVSVPGCVPGKPVSMNAQCP